MRQLIIARKDLPMSAGKLAAQVSHASMAWLSNLIRTASRVENGNGYRVTVDIDADTMMDGSTASSRRQSARQGTNHTF